MELTCNHQDIGVCSECQKRFALVIELAKAMEATEHGKTTTLVDGSIIHPSPWGFPVRYSAVSSGTGPGRGSSEDRGNIPYVRPGGGRS